MSTVALLSTSPRQQLNGAVPCVVAGRPRVLRFTLESIAALEQRDSTEAGMERLLALTWSMLLHQDPECDFETLAESLDYSDAETLARAVSECLRLSVALVSSAEKPTAKPTGARVQSDWLRIWSYAEHDLGLSETRFWGLTPRQFGALSDRHEEAHHRSLHGPAMVCSTLANIHRNSKEKPEPFTPADFLPALERRAAPDRQQNLAAVQDLRAKSREIFGGLSERVVRVTPTLPFLIPPPTNHG